MSKFITFLKPDLTMLSGVHQEQIIRKLVPAELIPAGWHCQKRSLIENIRNLYEESTIRIQMYGSPESLEKSILHFISFPGNEQFFQIKDCDFYKIYLPVYQSLGSNKYIYRKDMYDLLFEYIPVVHTFAPLEKLAHNLMMYYLRTLKNRVKTSHELIRIDEELKKTLARKKQLLEMKMRTGEWEKPRDNFSLDPKNSVELLDAITKVFKLGKIMTKMGMSLQKKINMVTRDVPIHENVTDYRNMLIWLYLTTISFEDFISKNKIMMFSRSETVHLFPTSKIPVRLFESNQDKVVMAHELLHAIKLENLDVSGFEDRILAMPQLSAISFREVFEMVPSDIFKTLEFVRLPLKNSSKDLALIPTIDGSHCLTAWQCLVLILNDVIIVKKLFQGMKREQWTPIMKEFYEKLTETFSDGSYFISYSNYEKAKLFLGSWFKRNFPTPNQNEISEVNKNGFTCKDIEEQLEKLDLSGVFPQVGGFAYKISPSRPTNGCAHETTKQMLQRIQDIQVSYVFNRLPQKLIKMFHERKWCAKLVPGRCFLCPQKQSGEPSVETKEGPKVPVVVSKVVQEKENHLDIAVNSSDTASSDESSGSSSTEKSDDSALDSSEAVKSVSVEYQVIQKPKNPVKTKDDSKVPVETKEVQEKEKILETDVSTSDVPSQDESAEKPDDSAPETLPETVESVVIKEQVSIQKPKKTKKKKNEKLAEKPEVKESQACPKCIRASEYTVKTNEKLRLSKIEVKHLRKELSEVQLALEEKEERIRILEERLQEKENQINLNNSEVESLNTKKQQLEQKNKRNERLIATFHEVITKKDLAIKSLQCHNHEKDQLIRKLKAEELKAIPTQSIEETEKVDSLLTKLMETKTILSKEDPLKKSNEICDYLITSRNSKVTQLLVKYETKVFQLQVSSYIQTVENNIKLIQGNQRIKIGQIPEIPDFPEFSKEFKDVHKFIMKKEAPLICRQLLKLTDEIADMECVICITDMESHDDTTKCGHCKRRYHNHCIKTWLKKKSICPTCKHGMIDEEEFPAL